MSSRAGKCPYLQLGWQVPFVQERANLASENDLGTLEVEKAQSLSVKDCSQARESDIQRVFRGR